MACSGRDTPPILTTSLIASCCPLLFSYQSSWDSCCGSAAWCTLKGHEMTTTLSSLVSSSSVLLPQVMVVEAPAGAGRHDWLKERLHEAAQSGARTFDLCCSFDAGGPWAGVNDLFTSIFPEIQSQRPDLDFREYGCEK